MRILVGSSGLIGQTLQRFLDFDHIYNSKNINEFDEVPNGCDLYLSCLPATKWLVNKNPVDDLKNAIDIFYKIKNKTYNNVYLFSTIDVYNNAPLLVNEEFIPTFSSLNYGSNRYLFETMVRDGLDYQKVRIVRLPGLFGEGLKKNILFDIKHNNNIDQINMNSAYQWYDLSRLENDLGIIDRNTREVVNVFPEPVHTIDIMEIAMGEKTIGYYGDSIKYNYRTLSSPTGYWYGKVTSLNEIRSFLCK